MAFAVGLFRRRTSLEKVLRGHLERLGVSSFWLHSALDAIHHCEEGDFFQPVFSVAGPAPARSVVALMRLEPFMRGEIDWTISPSESPFWVGSAGDLQDELFDATARRFLDLYWSERNPSVRPDLEAAFRDMVRASADEAPEATSPRHEDAPRGLWALGSAGYVWRVAESTARTSNLDLRAALLKEVEAVVASSPRGQSDERLLAWAATECVNRNLLFGTASPGGWAAGGEFLRRGFRFAERHVFPEDVALPLKDRWYAFSFGVALYDVDAFRATRPSRTAGRAGGRELSPQTAA
jgi:hypothetical protein